MDEVKQKLYNTMVTDDDKYYQKIDSNFIDLILDGKYTTEDYKYYSDHFINYISHISTHISKDPDFLSIVKHLESINTIVADIIIYDMYVNKKIAKLEYLYRKDFTTNIYVMEYIKSQGYDISP